MLTKSELVKLFTVKDFKPLKRFGENYLIDNNVKDKIITEAGLVKDDIVLEVGPGLGALTFDIASSGAHVTAIEKDRKAFNILKDMAGDKFPNLEIINGDILEFDLKELSKEKSVKIISNLPYYITTPIVEYLINNRSFVKSAILMMQKEVAHRFLAEPGTKDCSSISSYIRYYCNVKYIHTVGRGSFFPEPDVDSGIIRLDFLASPSVKVKDEAKLFKVIRSAFNQRRKSIINSLSRQAAFDIPKAKLEEALVRAKIDSSIRPERLTLAEFARIADNI